MDCKIKFVFNLANVYITQGYLQVASKNLVAHRHNDQVMGVSKLASDNNNTNDLMIEQTLANTFCDSAN